MVVGVVVGVGSCLDRGEGRVAVLARLWLVGATFFLRFHLVFDCVCVGLACVRLIDAATKRKTATFGLELQENADADDDDDRGPQHAIDDVHDGVVLLYYHPVRVSRVVEATKAVVWWWLFHVDGGGCFMLMVE